MSILIRLEKIASVFSSPVLFCLDLHTSLYLFALSCICFAGNDDCCSSGAQQLFDNWLQFAINLCCEQSYKK